MILHNIGCFESWRWGENVHVSLGFSEWGPKSETYVLRKFADNKRYHKPSDEHELLLAGRVVDESKLFECTVSILD